MLMCSHQREGAVVADWGQTAGFMGVICHVAPAASLIVQQTPGES